MKILRGVIILCLMLAGAVSADGPTCVDGDGGVMPEVASCVSGIGPNGWRFEKCDVCLDANILKEFWCNDGVCWPATINCAQGCDNGACISGQPTPSPTTEPSPSPTPTVTYTPPSQTDCAGCSWGTMLLGNTFETLDTMLYAHALGVRGQVNTGAVSPQMADWFGALPGWTRVILRGFYSAILNIPNIATRFGQEFDCIGYGPESQHGAGEEALDPLYWVPVVEEFAASHGKCLVYGPAVRDYEDRLTSSDEELAALVGMVAPHVDVWMIQLAKWQMYVEMGKDGDGNPYTMQDLQNRLAFWVDTIKGGNPMCQVWVQLGILRYDPINKECMEPGLERVLEFRAAIAAAGADGISAMPSMTCQNSDDPIDQQRYLDSFLMLQDAIDITCGS